MNRSASKNSSGRSNRRPSAQEKSSRPAFITGLLIGAAVMYFVPPMLDNTSQLRPSVASDLVDKANIQELKFDFYTLLKDNEILISDNQEAPKNIADTGKDWQYLLQAGSFKNSQDAESFKVELLLLNLPTESESVKGKNGDIWHRVLVGPFINTSKMASARAKLAQNEIDSLLLKRSQ
jgi:cell division protein FtsN